jgi:hypothetical protein
MTEPADDEVRSRITESVIAATVYEEAPTRGLIDPAGCIKLIDRTLLVFDDVGKPLNVLEALDVLLADSPYLIGDPPLRIPKQPSRPIRPMRISSVPNPHDMSRGGRLKRLGQHARS